MKITALVITKNEEIHIERCINSLKKFVDDILIVDSFSTDKTIEIAEKLNVRIVKNKFVNHSKQFNFGLSQLSDETDWVLKVDADELLTSQLIDEIKQKLPNLDEDVNGIYFKRQLIFQKKIIRYGRLSPVKLLRLFKFKKGYCDNRWVDEKIKIRGKTVEFKEYFYDHNLKTLNDWITKHNDYSSAEALNYLLSKYSFSNSGMINSKFNVEKNNIVQLKSRDFYDKLPLIIRSIMIFFFRYFICLGFLNGKAGLNYFFLQTLWYRIIVDLKILDVEKQLKKNTSFKDVVEKNLNLKIKE
jgi:glycosyltransferase involved in cell wall biosynthesis